MRLRKGEIKGKIKKKIKKINRRKWRNSAEFHGQNGARIRWRSLFNDRDWPTLIVQKKLFSLKFNPIDYDNKIKKKS